MYFGKPANSLTITLLINQTNAFPPHSYSSSLRFSTQLLSTTRIFKCIKYLITAIIDKKPCLCSKNFLPLSLIAFFLKISALPFSSLLHLKNLCIVSNSSFLAAISMSSFSVDDEGERLSSFAKSKHKEKESKKNINNMSIKKIF